MDSVTEYKKCSYKDFGQGHNHRQVSGNLSTDIS